MGWAKPLPQQRARLLHRVLQGLKREFLLLAPLIQTPVGTVSPFHQANIWEHARPAFIHLYRGQEIRTAPNPSAPEQCFRAELA